MISSLKVPIPFVSQCCSTLLKLCFSFNVEGGENLQKIPGPVILAGNHTGLLDGPMVLASVARPFCFLMSTEVFDWGLIGKLMPLFNVIPIQVDKPRQGLKNALNYLSHQQSICIFPEGKLSLNGELNTLNPGVALLQEKSGVPIVPFYIQSGFETWPIGQRLPRFKPVCIRYGEPLYPDQFSTRDELLTELRRQYQNFCRQLPTERPIYSNAAL